MRKLAAFLKRDLIIESSYRFAFVFQLVWVLFSSAAYYYLSRFIGKSVAPGALGAYGGDYFTFVLIGAALNDYHMTSLDVFSRSIREAQLTGTLEVLLTTQTSLSTIILSSGAYRLLMTTFCVLLYLVLGIWVFGMSLPVADWGAAILVLVLAILIFSSIGVFSASFVILFKRGSPIPQVLGGLSWLLGGVLYPVSVLPGWLRGISWALPMTYAVEGMRAALLQAAPWSQLWRSMGPLLLFAALLVPLSLASFSYATRRARVDGTLGHY